MFHSLIPSIWEKFRPIFVELAIINTVSERHRDDVNFKMGTKIKLLTKAFCIISLKLNLLSYRRWDDLGTTTTIHRDRCILSGSNNGNEVHGRIKKRGFEASLVDKIIRACKWSIMKFLACVTSKLSQRPMRTSGAAIDDDMLSHDRVAHLNMHILEGMTWWPSINWNR